MSPLATFSRQTSAHRSKTLCRYTFASSGDTTAPCGVPTFVSDHSPSSDTPAFSHFLMSRSTRLRSENVMQVHVCQQRRYHRPLRRTHLRLRPFAVLRYSRFQPLPDEPEHPIVGHPMLDELHRPFVVHVVEEPPNVRIEYPVHPLPLDARIQRVQRLMRVATWPKPIGKAPKVHLVYLIEDRYHRLLNDLVLQSGDTQGTLSPVEFQYVSSSRRLCPVRSTVHPAM